MKIKVSVTIPASPAVVWDDVENIANHVEWMADAESIEFLSHRHEGLDTSFVCVTKVGPLRLRDTMTITEWAPRKAMGIRHEGLVRGAGRFTLKSKRGATKFTWTERLTFPWYLGGSVAAIFAKPVLRAIWKRNLRRLAARF